MTQVSGKVGDIYGTFYASARGQEEMWRMLYGNVPENGRHISSKFGRGNAAACGRFSTLHGKTFNFSTEFYTLYSGLSTIFVENSVESVEKHGKGRQVFHIFPECYSLYITLC